MSSSRRGLKQVFLRLYPGRTWEQLRGVERSQRQRAIGLVLGVALWFMVLAAAAVWLGLLAESRRREADSRALAASAEQILSRDRPAALNLALQGWETAHTLEAHLAVTHSFPQLLATLRGHSGPINSAEFSPNGQRILTASGDDTARLWNTANGQLLTILQGHYGPVIRAVFSPDGERILTCSDDRTARVWSTQSGRLLATLQGHSSSYGTRPAVDRLPPFEDIPIWL